MMEGALGHLLHIKQVYGSAFIVLSLNFILSFQYHLFSLSHSLSLSPYHLFLSVSSLPLLFMCV